jgi:hypothetical protein
MGLVDHCDLFTYLRAGVLCRLHGRMDSSTRPMRSRNMLQACVYRPLERKPNLKNDRNVKRQNVSTLNLD